MAALVIAELDVAWSVSRGCSHPRSTISSTISLRSARPHALRQQSGTEWIAAGVICGLWLADWGTGSG